MGASLTGRRLRAAPEGGFAIRAAVRRRKGRRRLARGGVRSPGRRRKDDRPRRRAVVRPCRGGRPSFHALNLRENKECTYGGVDAMVPVVGAPEAARRPERRRMLFRLVVIPFLAAAPWAIPRRAEEGAAGRRGGPAGGRNSFVWIPCNPLKSPESDEGIQGNPRKSKRGLLGFPWIRLEKFGPRTQPGAAATRPGSGVRVARERRRKPLESLKTGTEMARPAPGLAPIGCPRPFAGRAAPGSIRGLAPGRGAGQC